jgi:hypothetical protein
MEWKISIMKDVDLSTPLLPRPKPVIKNTESSGVVLAALK